MVMNEHDAAAADEGCVVVVYAVPCADIERAHRVRAPSPYLLLWEGRDISHPT